MLMLASPGGTSETIAYSYDAHGRLVKVEHDGTVNNGVVTDYSYDAVDNRTNVTVTGAGAASEVSFSINSASATEGGIVQFTVTKAGTTSATHTVQYASANDSAGASDFTAVSGTLTFLAADTSKTISVQTTQDSTYEGDEVFTVALSSPSSGSEIGTATGTGTIIEDEAAPPGFAITNGGSVTEGGSLVFTVNKTGGAAASVSYAPTGTATSGSDYSASGTSGTLNFGTGASSQTITVTTIDDSEAEDSETVLMNLSNPTNGGTISDNQGSGTINDNDTPTTISIADASEGEGDNIVLVVTRSGPARAFSVGYATADGTANSTDYDPETGTVTFTTSNTTRTITVGTDRDSDAEETETFTVTLSSPTNGVTIVDGHAIASIIDRDSDVFSISDAQVTEGGTINFTIQRSGGTGDTTVQAVTSDDTALAGSDYTAKTHSIFFDGDNGGFDVPETTKTFSVNTIGNTTGEPTETFTVTLNPQDAGDIASDPVATGTILDDDSGGGGGSSFSIADGQANEGSNISFVITRTGGTGHSSTVRLTPSSGTATLGADVPFTGPVDVSFSSGQTSRTVPAPTNNDGVSESNETFTITLTALTPGDTVADGTAVGTIID